MKSGRCWPWGTRCENGVRCSVAADGPACRQRRQRQARERECVIILDCRHGEPHHGGRRRRRHDNVERAAGHPHGRDADIRRVDCAVAKAGCGHGLVAVGGDNVALAVVQGVTRGRPDHRVIWAALPVRVQPRRFHPAKFTFHRLSLPSHLTHKTGPNWPKAAAKFAVCALSRVSMKSAWPWRAPTASWSWRQNCSRLAGKHTGKRRSSD